MTNSRECQADAAAAIPSAGALSALPPAAVSGLACQAAAGGDIEGLRMLVKAGFCLDVGSPYDQRTPLHLAAAAGNLALVKFLVEECNVSLKRDRFGLLPVNDAVQNGHVEVRRYLQGLKMQWARERAELSRQKGRNRTDSMESLADAQGISKREAMDELMGTVFELVVKEGVFSYTTVYAEVSHFFRGLGLHPMYFEQFTAMQIAKHIHCLTAAKRVAQATNDPGRMDFALSTPAGGVFLTTIDPCQAKVPTDAQRRTENKIMKHLDNIWTEGRSFSLTFMASDGSLYKSSAEKLGIFTTELATFDARRVSEGETSLEVLASARFLKEKSRAAKEQYQIAMEDVVACGLSTVKVVPGSVYSGPTPSGHVLLFATTETTNRTYFTEVCQAMRFCGLSPRRFYAETFANRVIIYSLFFPTASMDDMHSLRRAILYSSHLKSTDIIYSNVMESRISHEVGLYLVSACKFVYAFFPKEQYAPEYTSVHKVLEKDPASQRQLETLYKLCLRDLLSTDRIFELLQRHLEIAVRFFEDFRQIATGKCAPAFNESLGIDIDKACVDPQDRQILRMFLTFNASLTLTNFFKAETPGALAFRLDPSVVLKGRPAALYPDVPHAIYVVSGRNFVGFHVRFRDVARGGIRTVVSRDSMTYDRNSATLFDECYNLALTQQMKNKDIAEGGSKGVILPDVSFAKSPKGSPPSPAEQRSCFTNYINSLLDCMLPEDSGIFSGHLDTQEILYFGPDENTANCMDLGAELARNRGYKYWKALTTGKSVKYGGVPHDTYGMTTASVHTYVTELLRKLGEDESAITKFQTGGPDGDLGSNEILVSKDKTIGIADGSGVVYDPAGLNREELCRLALARKPVREFTRAMLGEGGFLVTCEEVNVTLPDGSKWSTGGELRDKFHLTSYATADLFVPCGGRPNSITAENVKSLFSGTQPKFRIVVEGANLFLSDAARATLEDAGVHVFKDASTNKGGVCSSSLEVLASLALPDEEHTKLMTYNPDLTQEPPAFYRDYVKQAVALIGENARQEFEAIWSCSQKSGVRKIACTKTLSVKINEMNDSLKNHLRDHMAPVEKDRLIRNVISRAVPPLLLEKLGVDGILRNVPTNYVHALVGAWVASRFVYKCGIDASYEVSFFFFLREVLDGGEKLVSGEVCSKRAAPGTEEQVETEEPAACKPRLQ